VFSTRPRQKAGGKRSDFYFPDFIESVPDPRTRGPSSSPDVKFGLENFKRYFSEVARAQQKAFPPHPPRKRISGSDAKGIIVGVKDARHSRIASKQAAFRSPNMHLSILYPPSHRWDLHAPVCAELRRWLGQSDAHQRLVRIGHCKLVNAPRRAFRSLCFMPEFGGRSVHVLHIEINLVLWLARQFRQLGDVHSNASRKKRLLLCPQFFIAAAANTLTLSAKLATIKAGGARDVAVASKSILAGAVTVVGCNFFIRTCYLQSHG
jgi:hypothetical protein